jgi:predicted RNase H-like HicB family nuclease
MMAAKKKKSQVALKAKYKHSIEWDEEDKIWVVRFPELPGCSSHGATVEEAVKNGEEALALYLEACASQGIEVPQPISLVKASGKFMVRTRPEIHKRLLKMAADKNKSMNKLVEEILEDGIDK